MLHVHVHAHVVHVHVHVCTCTRACCVCMYLAHALVHVHVHVLSTCTCTCVQHVCIYCTSLVTDTVDIQLESGVLALVRGFLFEFSDMLVGHACSCTTLTGQRVYAYWLLSWCVSGLCLHVHRHRPQRWPSRSSTFLTFSIRKNAVVLLLATAVLRQGSSSRQKELDKAI